MINILWDASHIWGYLLLHAVQSTGIPFRVLKGLDISHSGLTGKMLIVPGGSARRKFEALGAQGAEAIHRFVKEGGHYMGFCGGAGLALSGGLGLCPWKRDGMPDRMQHLVSGHLVCEVASGKDITVVTKAGICNGEKKIDLALKVEDGEIKDMIVDYAAPAEYAASMDIFVLSKKFLIKSVQEMIARDKFHMDRDLVMGGWNRGLVTVNTYAFEGTAMFNESVEEYFANSMALIKRDIRRDIFGGAHPVYTKVRDRVPTYYGEGCEVENSLIADGCMLEGEVEDSILFREVTIGKDAEVENCILFNDAVIGEGAELKYVILDKNVTVTPGAKLIGTKNSPIIVKRGETV